MSRMENTMDARIPAPHGWRPLLLASLVLAVPGLAMAAGADLESSVRELERQQELDRARRDMAQRERTQREALRGQEESIRRLEEARSRLENYTREVAELSTQLGRDYVYAAPTFTLQPPPRALLGISVSDEQRRDGALVRDVSPGGAAEEAGIRRGDLIVSLDNTDLTRNANPAAALVEFMRQVEPDRKVRVGLLRDGKKSEVVVTARPNTAPAPWMGELRQRFDNGPQRIAAPPVPAPPAMDGFSTRLSGMEFATMSNRLGRYFGVVSGVLVVRAGEGDPFNLQDGDVILSIDGRTPTSAQHAGRILRSYQPGEKVTLRVQRDRKAIDVETAAPR
jgi:C-terminal processing protease CtpA/Prc